MNGNTKKRSSAWGGAKAAARGLCALALQFGLALAGCDNGSGPGGGGGGDEPGMTGPEADEIGPGPEVNGRSYSLGDTGPGGGKIFYVHTAGFTVYTSGTDTTGTRCHYLEAAPADISGMKMWTTSNPIYSSLVYDTAMAIGDGRKNTALILAYDPSAPAALACKNANYGGKTDWFLPSGVELAKLCRNRASVDSFGSAFYWSSNASPFDLYHGLAYTYDGSQTTKACDELCSVRAVRAF
jgi:hypothetical protein